MADLDGLDFGINIEESNLRSAIVHANMSDYTILNPFFVGVNGGGVKKMDKNLLFKNFNRVVIISRRENSSDISLFFKRQLSLEDFKSLSDKIKFSFVSTKLLKNKNHLNNANIVERNYLAMLSPENQFENNEIVLPFFEHNSETLDLYFSLYDVTNNLEDLIKLLSLYRYHNCRSYSQSITPLITQYTMNLREVLYWRNPTNCQMNMTDLFEKRKFQHKEFMDNNNKVKHHEFKDENIKNLFSKLSKKSHIEGNYLDGIHRKEIFTDAASTIHTKGKYKLYFISNKKLSVTKDEVANIFTSLDNERQQYDFLNALLLSKDHCHLVLNNEKMLVASNDIMTKFKAIFKLVIGYAFFCMYMEECVAKTRTTKDMRFVFDICTANKLPFFPYCHEDLHMNPYCPLLIASSTINASNNLLGVPMISNQILEQGIDTLENFKEKFNIFTTGIPNRNIFDGLEKKENGTWKSFAISGSSILPCSQRNNPLIEQISTVGMDSVTKYKKYFAEYYSESDIDVMSNEKSVFDFMDAVIELKNVVAKNLSEINVIDVKDVLADMEIVPVKSVGITVSLIYLDLLIENDPNFKQYTSEYIIKNLNSNEIKEFFLEKYVTSKLAKNREHRRTRKHQNFYEHFYKICSVDELTLYVTPHISEFDDIHARDSESHIYYNDACQSDKKVDDSKNIKLVKINENIKFKIISKYMLHNLEIFRIKYEEYFSCVARFHLPCVRQYYDGNQVYILPSCITAMNILLNVEYKYFAGIRDPCEIVNKYRLRGIGTIINEVEKKHLVEYNATMPVWKDMYGLDPNNKNTFSNHFGSKKLGDNVYKPGKFFKSIPDSSYNDTSDKRYVLTVADLYKVYTENYGYNPKDNTVDFLRLKTINSDGKIEPFKFWVLEAGYAAFC